jgi:alkylhydroperoxidase family enzyme
VKDLVEAIKERRWREVQGLSERDRALCEIAEKLSATPTRMLEDDWAPLRRLGFDDRACLEVAHIVGIFNHLTRLADGFGLQLDAGTRAAAESGIALRRGSL